MKTVFRESTEEEDEERLKECQHCSSCLEWHKYCNAECCSVITVKNDGFDLSKPCLKVEGKIPPDLVWYYELHGCTYARGVLKIPTKNAEVVRDLVVVRNRCSFLMPDNRCAGHPTRKPRICREMTIDTVRRGEFRGGSYVTPNCLFKYQRYLEKKGGTQ